MRRLWIYTLFGADLGDPARRSRTGLHIDEKYLEARKYDRSSWLMHWTLKLEDGSPPVSATVFDAKEEDSLLGTLFSRLNEYGDDTVFAGWRLNGLIWPKLVSKAVKYGFQLPQTMKWAKMDPTAKWPGGRFYDLYSIYTQGSFDRPAIELDEALFTWTGEHVMPDWQLFLDQTNPVPGALKGDLLGHADRVINLMQEVALRYDY